MSVLRSRLDFLVGSANSAGGLCAASGGGQLAGDDLEGCDGVKEGYRLLVLYFPACVSRRRIGKDRVGGVGRRERLKSGVERCFLVLAFATIQLSGVSIFLPTRMNTIDEHMRYMMYL